MPPPLVSLFSTTGTTAQGKKKKKIEPSKIFKQSSVLMFNLCTGSSVPAGWPAINPHQTACKLPYKAQCHWNKQQGVTYNSIIFSTFTTCCNRHHKMCPWSNMHTQAMPCCQSTNTHISLIYLTIYWVISVITCSTDQQRFHHAAISSKHTGPDSPCWQGLGTTYLWDFSFWEVRRGSLGVERNERSRQEILC